VVFSFDQFSQNLGITVESNRKEIKQMKEHSGEYAVLKNRVDLLTKMGISMQAIADGSKVNYTALRKWLREGRPLKDSQATAIENYIKDFQKRIAVI